MNNKGSIWAAFGAALIATVIAIIGTALPAAAAKAPASKAPAAAVSLQSRPASGGSGGGGGVKPAPPAMPADWPVSVPVPPGVLLGSTGRSPLWSVLLTVNGGAAQVQKSAIAFYVAHGFTADTGYIVHNAHYRLVMQATNRDHSATKSNLIIALYKL